MRITRGQLRRIVKEEAGRLGMGPDPAGRGSFESSEDFDNLLDDVLDAAKAHQITPVQVLEALRGQFEA
jgi:hypothetical protein